MIDIILSALSGVLTGLSFNHPYLSFLAWFSLTPFIYVLFRCRPKRAVVSGIIFALGYYGTAIFWIGHVTRLGFILILFYLSLYYVFFSLLGRYFLKRPLRIISIPCLWVIIEFLKENIWTGFGWANLGYSQYRNFHLIQAADIWGAKFISFLIVMVNVLAVELIIAVFSKKKQVRSKTALVKKAVFVLIIFMFLFTYGRYRVNTLKEEGFLEVAVVQPNIPQEFKWDENTAAVIRSRLELLGRKTKNALVIFPEAAWPYIVSRQDYKILEKFMTRLNREGILGAVEKDQGKFYNVSYMFMSVPYIRAEYMISSYRKIKLVPFGEYVPFRRFLSFLDAINSIGDISSGDTFTGFSYRGKRFSVLICFEDIFPIHVSQFSLNRDFLINITNDAWFKGEPQASQHLGIMTLRAVENRISIVRSANTGLSGWVSFKGEIEKFTRENKELFFSGVKHFDIALNGKRSFYTHYGELFPIFCGIFLIGIFVADRRRLH